VPGPRATLFAALIVSACLSRALGADTVELLDGTRIRGKVTERTETSVSVRTRQGMSMTLPLARVHAIKTGSGREVVNEKAARAPPSSRSTGSRGAKPSKVAGSEKAEELAEARPAYELEKWPRVPLLVWANPGKDGGFNDAANWNGGGRPNEETDVLLPASEKPYTVKAPRGSRCRHLTIEKNAAIIGTHGGSPFAVWGNCHIKEGGRIHFVDVMGPKHTYFRLDGGEFTKYRWTAKGWGGPWAQPTATSQIHHKMQIAKFSGGSVEFIGNVGIGDEFYLSRGRMIIGPKSEFRYNGSAGKGTFEIFDGATLELQSGAAVAPHKAVSSMNIFNLSIYRGGTLQAGSPRRPLTEDAYVRLGYDGKPGSGRNGMYCANGSAIKVYSRDPKTTRLVFTAVTHAGTASAEGDQRGIEVHLGGRIDLEGVLFDCVRLGGIHLADMELPKRATDLFFGPRNAGEPSALFSPMTVNPDVYYHKRRYMRYGRVQDGLRGVERATGEKVNVPYPGFGAVHADPTAIKWTATKKDPPEAREMLAKIEKGAQALKKKLRGKKATDPRMAQRYRREFVAIGRAAIVLRAKYPDTGSCERALAICEELGLKLPEKK
jgi:hypothetical protein